MKETIKILGIVLLIGIIGSGIIMGLIWLFSDPFNLVKDSAPQVQQTYSYSWNQCFDNEDDDFSQEYADKIAREAEQNHPNGEWIMRGKKDIIGCGGDLFYYYVIK